MLFESANYPTASLNVKVAKPDGCVAFVDRITSWDPQQRLALVCMGQFSRQNFDEVPKL